MSSSSEDRFARLAALRPARKHERVATPGAGEDHLAALVGAVAQRNRYGEHLVVRRWYSAPEEFAPSVHAMRLLLPDQPGKRHASHERLADPAEWLFLDAETTGLAGGTGTYAFLVGLAWWEAGGLQVEQFFMRDYSEEHSLLLELSRRLAERRVLVTFNGKSFDWPLLETRYLMTRSITPRPPVAHLDLLHPARQLWRLRLGSVRLVELERHVLGPHRLGWDRRDDIDAALIPQIYFDYLRGSRAEPLTSVFRHNQMDLRGLAALAGRIFALLSEPEIADSTEDALELYGLSRLFRRRRELSKARQLYERALEAGLPAAVDRAARRELALLAKRERDFARATSLWQELLQNPDGDSHAEPEDVMLNPDLVGVKHLNAEILRPAKGGTQNDRNVFGRPQARWNSRAEGLEATLEACEQLAIYYEHRAREHSRAAQLTREALTRLRQALRAGRMEPGRCRRWQARLEHRLARLIRSRPLLDPAFAEARRTT